MAPPGILAVRAGGGERGASEAGLRSLSKCETGTGGTGGFRKMERRLGARQRERPMLLLVKKFWKYQ